MSPNREIGQIRRFPGDSHLHCSAASLGLWRHPRASLPVREEAKLIYENSYLELGTYANDLIRSKARQLIGKEGFTSADGDDLEQDLALDLLRRLEKFDPAKSKRTTFMTRVVEHRIATIIEERRAACRDWRRCRDSLDDPFFQDEDEYNSHVKYRLDPRTRTADDIALTIDLDAALASLPAELRDLWNRLLDSNIHRVSKETGISRDTLYARFKRLQAALLAAGI